MTRQATSTSFEEMASPVIKCPSLSVSISQTTFNNEVRNDFEDLEAHSDENSPGHLLCNELRDYLLERDGLAQLKGLKSVVDRTVSDAEYRNLLSREELAVDNLVKVLKQTIVRFEPIYDQMAMSVDALRMDTGSVDDDHQRRLYIVHWSLVLRILNILKNLLVSNPDIQETLYQHKVILQMIKLLPKAMVARELTIRLGPCLLGDVNSAWSHNEVPRAYLKMAMPICGKADTTLITFFLNSIAASPRMQALVRPQLWSGPMAILALTVVGSRTRREGSMDRYARDLANYITLFHTLFLNVNEKELADWWELEESPLWNPRGELGHERTNADNRAALNNSLQRTATNLSMQLSIPGWNAGMNSDTTQNGTHRHETVVGALMEPQTSSVEGKGVHMDRMKSFRVIADKSGGTGSLGLNGRESLLVILTTILAGLRAVDASDATCQDAHYAWDVLIKGIGRHGGLQFWHAFFKSFKKCRAISRLMKAISLTSQGPTNPMSDGYDVHREESIFPLMADAMIVRIKTLFELMELDIPELTLDKMDDFLLYHAENLNGVLIRACIGEVLLKEVLVKILVNLAKTADDGQISRVTEFLQSKVSVEANEDISFLGHLIKGSEEHDNVKFYTVIKDTLETPFRDHPEFKSLIDSICDLTEEYDSHDPISQVSSGHVFRLAIECFRRLGPNDPRLLLLRRALESGFRWLKTCKRVIMFEDVADKAEKNNLPEAAQLKESVVVVRRHLVQVCRMSATICLELITAAFSFALENKDPEAVAVAKRVCIQSQGVEDILYCCNMINPEEPTMRERATLALAGLTSVSGEDQPQPT